jgi:hypothetical protein
VGPHAPKRDLPATTEAGIAMTGTMAHISRLLRRRQGSPRAHGGSVAGALAAGALLLAACGATASSAAHPHASERVGVAAKTTGCATTVHGVVPGPGMLAAQWLPAGFRLTSGTTSDPSSGLTYSSTGSDPPRIELHLSNSPGPLTAAAGGRTSATTIDVQGHPGLLEEGPPDPRFIGAYWKPTASHLLSVVGYKLPAATVIQVARQVTFSPPDVVSLPVQPGPIVTKTSAVAAAKRATHLSRPSAQAKLSSWSEVSALLRADHATPSSGASVIPNPWKPVWAVLLTGNSPGAGSTSTSSRSSGAELVVVDAASGKALAVGAVAHHAWFAALTNRDPSLRGCPGGSTARLPFGVLTREEESYVATSFPAPLGAPGATRSVILKLTTVPVLNRADPGLYGGCVQQSCSLDELVWPAIAVVHAPAGKTLACLPPWASYPAGYQPKQVRQYVTISVAGSSGVICGPVPKWVNQLADLAPPASKWGAADRG